MLSLACLPAAVSRVCCAVGAGMVVLRRLHRRRPQAPSAFQAEGDKGARVLVFVVEGVS